MDDPIHGLPQGKSVTLPFGRPAARRHRTVHASILAVLLATTSLAAEPNLTVKSYTIDVSCAPERAFLSATTTVQFAAPSRRPASVVFYVHSGLHVESVEIGAKRVPHSEELVDYNHSYTTKANRISVSVPADADLAAGLTVSYAGKFEPSAARSPSDYMRIDSDGVLLRSYGYSLWLPIFLGAGEEAYSVDFPRVTIRVPHGFVPVFTGTRLKTHSNDTETVSEWHAEHVGLFAAQLTARRYDILTHESVFIYHERDDASRRSAKTILSYVQEMFALFSRFYGQASGFEQIHVMQMPEFGDMSSGNVIGITTDTWRAFETQTWTKQHLAHEFVHPFVRVRTPTSDPLYALMIEGFPSYFHLPIMAERDGEGVYASQLNSAQQRYLTNRRTGKTSYGQQLPPEKPLYEITPDEVGIYKDAFVLSDRALLFFDYLRRSKGKTVFFDFTRELFARESLDSASFEALVHRHFKLPDDDLRLWLRTTQFPDRFKRQEH